MRPTEPPWTSEVDRVLARATREAPLLASATPVGGMTRAALIRDFERGEPRDPQWVYAPSDGARAAEMARSLEALAGALEAREPSPLARAYAARAREIALEAVLGSEAGKAGFAARARARFVPEGETSEASCLARTWIVEPHDPEDDAPADRASDLGNGSLAARLREEIGRRKLAFRVVDAPSLAPLAATGDTAIWVATGRALTSRDVERTVLHEIEGHALPRARARQLPLGLFGIGTANGVDEQEGLALVYEDRGGFLRGARRRELALRHRVVEAMDAGAGFVDAVRTIAARDGATFTRVIAAAERAYRGSDGVRAGLGRERVYLASFARVAAHLAESPGDERVLASGQVAVAAIDALAPFAGEIRD